MSKVTDDLVFELTRGKEYSALQLAKPEWGQWNFNSCRQIVVDYLKIIDSFREIRLNLIPDRPMESIAGNAKRLNDFLAQIERFNPSTGISIDVIQEISNNIKQSYDDFIISISYWIPFVDYLTKSLDVRNTELNNIKLSLESIYENSLSALNKKSKEIDSIIDIAKNTVSSAAVNVYINGFNESIEEYDSSAKKWLISAGILALSAVAFLFCFLAECTFGFIKLPTGNDHAHVIAYYVGKIAIVSMLFSASLWFARNYKIRRHLSETVKQKRLIMQTYQAFFESSTDSATKDKVIKEAIKSIFVQFNPGFITDAHSEVQGAAELISVLKPNS